MISRIRNTLSKFWTHHKESLEVESLKCAKFSGVTTQRKKILGKEKMSLRQIFLSFFPIYLNLEDEILFKGVGFVTPKIPSLKNASNKIRI
jgi:hypothetical protein